MCPNCKSPLRGTSCNDGVTASGCCPFCNVRLTCATPQASRPSDYELFRTVEQALSALHPRSAEEAKAALRALLNRLNVARDTFDDQADRIAALERRCA